MTRKPKLKCYLKTYAKVNKYNNKIEFAGTMKELSEYEGVSEYSIRSYISQRKKANKFCPYILIGYTEKMETEEEKRKRRNAYNKRWRMMHGR